MQMIVAMNSQEFSSNIEMVYLFQCRRGKCVEKQILGWSVES